MVRYKWQIKYNNIERPFDLICLKLLHCVRSVGKSTIINALLRGHYCPTSVTKETQCISKFRIHVKNPTRMGKRKVDGSLVDLCEGSGQTAESVRIHNELKENNDRLRESEKLEEKLETVYVESFLGEIRQDTMLSLIDIPGLNEGDADKKKSYLEWVNNNWSQFDCVVLVIDASTGVDTSEAIETLHLVKRLCRDTRTIPVIILCNKVDDPINEKKRKNPSKKQEDIEKVVANAHKEIQKIFGVSDRKLALEEFLKSKESQGEGEPCKMPSPAFLPVSARFALLFYAANRKNFTSEDLKKYPIELIEQFGEIECMLKEVYVSMLFHYQRILTLLSLQMSLNR
jgi:GTP-binding protein EngB required for normal cell division